MIGSSAPCIMAPAWQENADIAALSNLAPMTCYDGEAPDGISLEVSNRRSECCHSG